MSFFSSSPLSSLQSKRLLKMAHLFSAGLWIGGTAALTALICLYHPQNPGQMHAQNSLLMLLDFYIIAPGALGCLLTGLLYGWKTKYGFFRFRWIVCKWLLNLAFITFGGLVVVPWLENALAASSAMQTITPENTQIMLMHMLINVVQWSVIVFILYLSVFKPWMPRKTLDDSET